MDSFTGYKGNLFLTPLVMAYINGTQGGSSDVHSQKNWLDDVVGPW